MLGGRTFTALLGAILLVVLPVGASALPAQPPLAPEVDTFCFEPMKPCGEPVVFGSPVWASGKVIAYGYSSGDGTCIDYAHPGGGSGTCGADSLLQRNGEIFISGLNWSSASGGIPAYTEVSGVIRPDVAGVRVRYMRKGEVSSLDAFTYQVAGKVQRKLKAPWPFGVFEASILGCVPTNHFRVTAFDASGARLGTSHIGGSKDRCRNRRPGTGGVIIFGRDEVRALPSAS